MTDAKILDETVDQLSHNFRMALAAKPVDAAVDAQLRELARNAKAAGFRPGRVPLPVLRRRHGSTLRHAVIDRMAIAVARNLIAQRGLEPVRRPTIEIDEISSAPQGTVEFSLLIEVAPRFELGRLDDITLKRLQVPGGDAAMAEQSRQHLRRQLFDALMERYDFAVPSEMTETEYARIVRGFEQEVGESIDAELETELRRIARRRIRLAILLTEIGRVHGIEVSRAEVEALVEQQAEREPDHQTEVIDYYLDHPAALAELQSPLFEDRVVDFLIDRNRNSICTIDVTAGALSIALEPP